MTRIDLGPQTVITLGLPAVGIDFLLRIPLVIRYGKGYERTL